MEHASAACIVDIECGCEVAVPSVEAHLCAVCRDGERERGLAVGCGVVERRRVERNQNLLHLVEGVRRAFLVGTDHHEVVFAQFDARQLVHIVRLLSVLRHHRHHIVGVRAESRDEQSEYSNYSCSHNVSFLLLFVM